MMFPFVFAFALNTMMLVFGQQKGLRGKNACTEKDVAIPFHDNNPVFVSDTSYPDCP